MSKKKRAPKFLRALMAKQQQHPCSITERVLSSGDASLQKEVDYILQRADAGDSRVVGFNQLVFFSTATCDAWMLDWQDELAICLMRDGVPQPYELGETDRAFTIQWTGRYHIQGELFSYIDNKTPTHARVIGGYPTNAIIQTIDHLRHAM